MKGEEGTSAVELLLALAITGLITGILVTAIYQIYHITGWGYAELMVQHDLQNAATWLHRDVVCARSATPNGTGSQIVLTVPYLITGTRTITYTYVPATKELIRISNGSWFTVAHHIVFNPFPPTTHTITSNITITLTSWVTDVTARAVLHLDMRPTE